MTFRFNSRKATEAASKFIEAEGGQMNVMKLVKLVYLLDRLSIQKRGIPVIGGVYYSLRNGPVTSELLDIINSGRLADEEDTSWEQFISDRQDHQVGLLKPAPTDFLSESEIQLIGEIHREHGGKDQWSLRDWCHKHCGEWTPLENGRERIQVEEMARNVGKTNEEIRAMRDEASESNLLESAFRKPAPMYA